MVNGHWALGKCLTGKQRQTDVVIGPPGNELNGNLLGCLDSVRLEVLSQHTGTYVHTQHNVNTVRLLGAPVIGSLRSCQCNDCKDKAGYPQHKGEMKQVITQCLRSVMQSVQAAYPYWRCGFKMLQKIPYNVRYQQEQQKEICRRCKCHNYSIL